MSALDVALDAINDAVPETSDAKQLLIAAKCRGLMMGYHARWSGVAFEVLAVEQFIETGLYNPDTGKSSRTFTLAGKKDVVVNYQSQRVLIDHKSCSEDIEDPNADYWRQLAIEAQPSHYMMIDWLNGEKVDYAIWDVIRKPGIAPKELSAAAHKMAVMTHEYCGYKLSDESIAELAATKRENLEMYTARLAQDCISERPQRYFQRRAVPRLDNQILEHAQEVWSLSQEIIAARRENRWMRNSKACMLYGTACKFLGICSGYDTPDSDRWTRKKQMHNELPAIQGDGRSVLTNSRLGTYQTCRRKHFYEFELGIERVDEEERESLYFGTLLHLSLDAWFSYQQPTTGGIQNGNIATDLVPVSEIRTIGGTAQSLFI